MCVCVDSRDSSGWWWVGFSLPTERRDLSVQLCCQHRHSGWFANQPCTERSGGKYTLRYTDTVRLSHGQTVCGCVSGQVSELYRTGRPVKSIDKASSDEQADRFVTVSAAQSDEKQRGWRRASNTDMSVCVCVCVTDRCRSLVEKFLHLDLEDQDLDLQHFMKEELLPSAGELLNHSWTALLWLQTCFCSSVVSLFNYFLMFSARSVREVCFNWCYTYEKDSSIWTHLKSYATTNSITYHSVC